MRIRGGRFDCQFENDGRVAPYGTPSTLLIPAKRYTVFRRLVAKHGGKVSILLRNMLERHRLLLWQGLMPACTQVNTRYQAPHGDYSRITFRPYQSDWLQLGQLALAHGMSRCLFFDYLLTLENSDYYDTNEMPLQSPSVRNDLRNPYCLHVQLDYYPLHGIVSRAFDSFPIPEDLLSPANVFAFCQSHEAQDYPWPDSRYL